MQISIDESRQCIVLHETLPSRSKRGKAGSYEIALNYQQAMFVACRILELASMIDPGLDVTGKTYCPTQPRN